MDHISCRGTDDRLLVFFDKLNTLNSGIRSLVKLSRKKFYRKDSASFFCRKFFFI